MINVLLAENHYLIRQGVKRILTDQTNIRLVGEALTMGDLQENLLTLQPDVLMIDYTSEIFEEQALKSALRQSPYTNILAITPTQTKSTLIKGIELQINSFLLKSCEREEILDAIQATAEGENFFCGKILEKVLEDENLESNDSYALIDKIYATCEPLKISEREIEIIRLIAEGLTTKEIADQLFLSTHTIVTHRKNIMRKLGISNTAGLVVYAVQEQIIQPN